MYRLPKGIQEMNNALAGSGGDAIVKLRIAEALQGKSIILLPVSEGGMNLKTNHINQLIETLGVTSLTGGQAVQEKITPLKRVWKVTFHSIMNEGSTFVITLPC